MTQAPQELRIWTPLPPAKSGIAHYSRHVFGALEKAQSGQWSQRFVTRALAPYQQTADGQNAKTTGLDLLQLGNNPDHDYIFQRAEQGGAILEFHDLSLHHLYTYMSLRIGETQQYEDFLAQSHGDVGRQFAQNRQMGVYHPRTEFIIRCVEGLLPINKAIIVHSDWAKHRLRPHTDKPIYVIPHFSESSIKGADGESILPSQQHQFRRDFNLSTDKFTLVFAGFVTKPKKLDWLLAALDLLPQEKLDQLQLVIAGDCQDAQILAQIEKANKNQGGDKCDIHLLGYVDDADFDKTIAMADMVANLRYPSVGESSGVLHKTIAMGRKALCCDLMSFTAYDPEHVAFVGVGEDVISSIAQHISAQMGIVTDIKAYKAQSQAIFDYAQQFSIEASVAKYQTALSEIALL